MMRRLALLSLWLVACGDDVVDPADVPFEPLCGENGPVELLPLADDEEVGGLSRVDEAGGLRVLVYDTDEDTPADASLRRHVIVDRCGEQVTELASNVSYVARWRDALIGCIDDDLVRLSRYDDPAPTLIAQRGCAARSIGELWITFDVQSAATVGRLLALEPSGSIVESRVLVEDVLIGDYRYGIFPAVVDDRVFVQTSDFAVHGVDPRTGAITLELEAAEPKAWHPSTDAIAYRAPVLDPEAPGPVVIRQRQSGTEQLLGAEIPTSWWFGWWADGLLTAKPDGPPTGQRWWRLDPLRELVPPEGMRIETVRANGLVWLGRFDETNGSYSLLRWREGEEPQLAWTCGYCYPSPLNRESDSIEVVVQGTYASQYELWKLDDTGGPARRIANPVGSEYFTMEDGRVLTVPSTRDDMNGPLVLYTGEDAPAVTLVPHVQRRATGFTAFYRVPDEIVYEALPHPDGTHALYRARLTP